jgi:hypothetical protein
MRTMINASKPNLVIVTGDIVSGDCAKKLNEGDGFYKKRWESFTKPFLDLEIHYAITLGDADRDGDMAPHQIMELEMTHPFSLSQLSNLSNPATYAVPVLSYQFPSDISANLWLFDTGAYGCDGKPDGYGCIERDQIAWYEEESRKFYEQFGDTSIHLAFFHIPIPEYGLLLKRGAAQAGIAEEPVRSPLVNTGFLSAATKNIETFVSAIFVGHDHLNNYRGYANGVELIYGRKFGLDPHGPPNDIKRGRRVITLYEGFSPNGLFERSWDDKIVNFDGTFEYDKQPFENRMISDTPHIGITLSQSKMKDIMMLLMVGCAGICLAAFVVVRFNLWCKCFEKSQKPSNSNKERAKNMEDISSI